MATPLIFALVIVGCLLVSAFFSGSETALLRLRLEEVDQDAKKAKGPAAVAARELLKSTSRLLVTLLLGNNVANILGAATASALAIHYFGEQMGLLISTVSMTFLVLIFSEILPKALAAQHPKKISYLVALPLYLLHMSLFAVHWFFGKIIDPLIKKFAGGNKESRMDSSEELLRLARRMRNMPADGSPASIIAATAGAAEMTVSDVMTPRTEILAFSVQIPVSDVLDKMVSLGHTRAPIFESSLDRIIGIVHVKDLIRLVRHKKNSLKQALKPVLRVPERKSILPLLHDMQRGFAHMAVVKDEFGVTQGLITQEDILEEIVGEIRDEFDKEELKSIRRVSEGVFEVLGKVLVKDFNRDSGWEIQAERGDTISGLVFNLLGRAPVLGDEIALQNYILKVTGVSSNRITRVQIKQLPPQKKKEAL